MKSKPRVMMSRFICLCTVVVLTSCSGGDSQEQQTTQPAPGPVIANPLVNCGTYSTEPPVALPWKLSRPSDWVVMGSSSAFGAGASMLATSWVGLIAAEFSAKGVQVHNIAKGGYTSYHALAGNCVVAGSRPVADPLHNIDKAFELKPDLVFLSYPSNDAVSMFTATETASNLLLLRWQLMQQGIAVVVLSAQPRNTNVAAQAALRELDQLLRPVISSCFVELYSALESSSGGLANQFDSGDGVHLNDAGHQIVADAVNKTLNNGRCVELL